MAAIPGIMIAVEPNAPSKIGELTDDPFNPGKPIEESATINNDRSERTGVIFHSPPYTLISRV